MTSHVGIIVTYSPDQWNFKACNQILNQWKYMLYMHIVHMYMLLTFPFKKNIKKFKLEYFVNLHSQFFFDKIKNVVSTILVL